MSYRRYHISEIPLLFPAAALTAGIVLPVVADGIPWIWWGGLAVVVCIAGLCVRRPRLALAALAFVIGVGCCQLSRPRGLPIGEEGYFEGKVVSVENYGSTQRYVVGFPDGTRISVPVNDYPYLAEVGDVVCFYGRLYPAFSQATVPDEQTGRYFALTNYLSARCVVRDGSFKIVKDASGLRGMLNGTRRYLLDAIRTSGLSKQTTDFMEAVILGEHSVDDATRERFSNAGLSHVLALSGTHVSTVVFLMAFLMFPVTMAGYRKTGVLLTLAGIWAYAGLTGFSPSVVRAVIMASFLMVGRLVGKYTNPINSLSGAAILILLFDPMAVLRPGFQMSFLAVAGILMIMPMVKGVVAESRWSRYGWVRLEANSVGLPVAAVVATAPLSAWYFHSFPVWFLMANLPVAMLLPILICGGLVLMLLSGCGITSSLLVDGLDGVFGWVDNLAGFVSDLPGVGENSVYFPGWLLIPIYSGLLLMWLGWNNRRKVMVINGCVVLLFVAVLFPVVNPVYPEREVFVWRDGMATNILLKEYNRVYVITDAPEKYHGDLRERAEIRLVDFLGKRNATLEIVSDTLSIPGVDIRKDSWMIDGRRYHIMRNREDIRLDPIPAAKDVLVVTSGFRGDILELYSAYPSCPMVLSPALPPQRKKRYADRLSKAGYPFYYDLSDIETLLSR